MATTRRAGFSAQSPRVHVFIYKYTQICICTHSFNRTALPPPDVGGSTERRREHPGHEQKHPESSEDGRHVIFMLCLLTCFELPSTTSSSCKALPRRKIHQRPRSGSMPPRQVSTQSIKNNMLPILSAMPKANFPSKAMPCHRGAFSLSR